MMIIENYIIFKFNVYGINQGKHLDIHVNNKKNVMLLDFY